MTTAKQLVKEMPNFFKPIKRVKYALLETYDNEHAYRRKCPVCQEGILLVSRNGETLKIEKIDRCITCGQTVEYIDAEEVFGKENRFIDESRRKEHGHTF